MNLKYTSADGRMAIEFNGDNQKHLFRELAGFQQVFEAETQCGLCKCPRIAFGHRQPKGYDYYELVCQDCGARFSFGQAKEGGGLFPKRDGPGKGWEIYQPDQHQQHEEAPRQQQTRQPPPQRSAPASVTNDPMLNEYRKRAAISRDHADDVFGELLDRVAAAGGNRDGAWMDAVADDPPVSQVVDRLYKMMCQRA